MSYNTYNDQGGYNKKEPDHPDVVLWKVISFTLAMVLLVGYCAVSSS